YRRSRCTGCTGSTRNGAVRSNAGRAARSTMSTPTVNSLRLYERVAALIEQAIAKGQYQMGQRLASEPDLAEALGVSRPTVRRAVIALEMRGLLEARQGSGVYVRQASPPTAPPRDLDIGAFDQAEARRLFEGEAAALAATLITDQELT